MVNWYTKHFIKERAEKWVSAEFNWNCVFVEALRMIFDPGKLATHPGNELLYFFVLSVSLIALKHVQCKENVQPSGLNQEINSTPETLHCQNFSTLQTKKSNPLKSERPSPNQRTCVRNQWTTDYLSLSAFFITITLELVARIKIICPTRSSSFFAWAGVSTRRQQSLSLSFFLLLFSFLHCLNQLQFYLSFLSPFLLLLQIMEIQHDRGAHIVSYLQVRGSVPLFWSQSGMKYRPPPKLERSELNVCVFSESSSSALQPTIGCGWTRRRELLPLICRFAGGDFKRLCSSWMQRLTQLDRRTLDQRYQGTWCWF